MRRYYHQETLNFTAAHRYEQAAWSDEDNALTFGPCYFPDGHGHDYRLLVEVELDTAKDTDSPKRLQEVLWALHDELDHRHLNKVVPRFQDSRVVPTTENVAVYLLDEIKKRAPKLRVSRVRLYERQDLWSEIVP